MKPEIARTYVYIFVRNAYFLTHLHVYLKGSIYGSGQPICTSFQERDQNISCSNPKQQNLWETAKSPNAAKSQFERDSNRNISWSLSQKEVHIGCPDPQRLALQGQLITSKSDRTWLPGAAFLTNILKGATL